MERNHRAIVHPDENLLTAFAERTLARGERERVIAHWPLLKLPDAIFSQQTVLTRAAVAGPIGTASCAGAGRSSLQQGFSPVS